MEQNKLIKTLFQNLSIKKIVEEVATIEPQEWYLGAGCIPQTIWNEAHGYPLSDNIKDYDLVYFDEDLSQEKEEKIQQKVTDYFSHLGIHLDVVNQARVHLWYKKYFGYTIKPYKSIEDAISTWPTTATAIVIACDSAKEHTIVAPYGLDDLYNLVIRPNKKQITEEIYNAKVKRWTAIWPKLQVIAW